MNQPGPRPALGPVGAHGAPPRPPPPLLLARSPTPEQNTNSFPRFPLSVSQCPSQALPGAGTPLAAGTGGGRRREGLLEAERPGDGGWRQTPPGGGLTPSPPAPCRRRSYAEGPRRACAALPPRPGSGAHVRGGGRQPRRLLGRAAPTAAFKAAERGRVRAGSRSCRRFVLGATARPRAGRLRMRDGAAWARRAGLGWAPLL